MDCKWGLKKVAVVERRPFSGGFTLFLNIKVSWWFNLRIGNYSKNILIAQLLPKYTRSSFNHNSTVYTIHFI